MKSINEIIESYQFIDTYVNENKTDTIKDIVSNEDIGYMFDVISDKLENEVIQQIEQSIFLNQ